MNSTEILISCNNVHKALKYMISDASNVELESWEGQRTLDTIRQSCFHSQQFNLAYLRCFTYQKELFAIINSLHLFKAQLRGHKCVILTDYKLLLTFMQGRTCSQKVWRWQDLVITFACIIEHTGGKDQ